MKKLLFLLSIIALPMVVACSSSDENEPFDINNAIGTWMCIQSRDTYQGQSQEGLLVGAEITIYKDGTYTSTSNNFGYNGTYTSNGNQITAKNKSGGSFVVTVSIKGDKMTWNGTANNGVNFSYVFQREGSN